MVERYIELRMLMDFYIPIIILVAIVTIVIVTAIIVGIMRLISNSWKKRQDRMNEKYFEKHSDEE